jgi:hypothetical protein
MAAEQAQRPRLDERMPGVQEQEVGEPASMPKRSRLRAAVVCVCQSASAARSRSTDS